MIDKLEHNAAAIKRWRSRLKRAMSMLEKLERQRKRLERPRPLAQVLGPVENVGSMPPVPKGLLTLDKLDPPPADTDGIPVFLRRPKLDPVAEQIVAEQQEAKRLKAAGRIAKMKAKKTGETRKMPLTGKAALQAIRHG